MPRKRQPKEIWAETRREVWGRDGGACQSPLSPPVCQGKPAVALNACHVDHIQSGKRAGNEKANLRTLCRACHVLRIDNRHRGMLANALRDGIIPDNWKDYVWGEG